MADVIKEYAIQISVQGSKAVIKDFKQLENVEKKQNKQLKETNSLLWTYAKRLLGIWAIYRLITKGINLGVSFAEQGNSLKNLATVANVSTRTLQKWGQAVKKFGGDEKSVASTMGTINQKLHDRQYGIEPYLEYVKRYGALPAGNSAEDFLINVAKKMEQYTNPQDKRDIASTLNLDDAMTAFLMQGSKEVARQLKQASILYSEEDIENASKAKEQLILFNREVEKLGVALGRMSLAPLTDLIKELTSFLQDPKKYIKNALKDSETSVYGVAKSMFDVRELGRWGINRIKDLTDFSATTGKDKYLSGVDYLSRNIFGKDYEGAMSLFEGAGSALYASAGRYAEKALNVNNDVSLTFSGSTESISNQIDDVFDDLKDKVKTVYRQAGGIN